MGAALLGTPPPHDGDYVLIWKGITPSGTYTIGHYTNGIWTPEPAPTCAVAENASAFIGRVRTAPMTLSPADLEAIDARPPTRP